MSTYDICNQVQVKVTGTRPEQMRDKALDMARKFFQVDDAQLLVSPFLAEPGDYFLSGVPEYWEATVVVFLVKP